VLDVSGSRQEIPNDFVWIFAGGTPPNDFLKKIGVAFGMHDMTAGGQQRGQGGQDRKGNDWPGRGGWRMMAVVPSAATTDSAIRPGGDDALSKTDGYEGTANLFD
jgi:hypothetical protein